MTETPKKKGQIFDGISLMNLLFNKKTLNRESIFCYFPHYVPATNHYPSTAMWSGNYKMIKVYGEGENREPEYQLFNLKTDISEKNNIANLNTKILNKMIRGMSSYLRDVNALLPVKNPKYKNVINKNLGKPKRFQIEKYPSYFFPDEYPLPYRKNNH